MSMKRLMVLAALLVAGCDQPEPPQNAANAVNAAHCANALQSESDLLDHSARSSALANPWSITSVINAENQLRLRCEVVDNGYRAWVAADVICDNVDDLACVKVVEYNRTDEPYISSIRR